MKTVNEFRTSLKEPQPPEEISVLLKALWWEAKGNWDQAHKIAQDIHNPDAAWVHAYLHRREGNEGNAGYWYSRAGKPKSNQSLDQEWELIVGAFLEKHSLKTNNDHNRS